MEFHIGVDPETGWGNIEISGDIGLDDLKRLFMQAWSDPGYAEVERALWRIAKARTGLRFDDLVELTRWIVANKRGRGPRMIAIAAMDDVTFGMSRMFDSLQNESGWTVRVFRSVEAAGEWLRADAEK